MNNLILLLQSILTVFLEAVWKLARLCFQIFQLNVSASGQKDHVVASTIFRRWRPFLFQPCAPSDFLLWKSRLVPLDILLKPDVTLYCVTRDVAVFVKCPASARIFNTKTSPFFYFAQYKHAVEAYTVPKELFHRLAEKAEDCRVPVTWISNTGRCGSTILTQMMEQVPGVVCVSEPDCLVNISGMRSSGSVAHEEVTSLLKSAVRLLVHNAQLQRGQDVQEAQHVVVKTRSECSNCIADIFTLFPDHLHVYMHRNIMAVLQSYKSLLCLWPSLMVKMADSHLLASVTGAFRRAVFRSWPFGTPKDKQFVIDLIPRLSVVGIMASRFCIQMRRVRLLRKKGLPIYDLSYEELLEDPVRVVTELFEHLGLSENRVAGALKAMEQRSQKAVLPDVKAETLTEREISDISKVMMRFEVQN